MMLTETSERIKLEQFLKGHTYSLIANDEKIWMKEREIQSSYK